MQTTRMTTDEFEKNFGDLSERTRSSTIVVTEDGQDALVVLSPQEWERLRRRDRRVGATSELSDEWLAAVEAAKVPDEYAFLDNELKAEVK